MLARLLRDGVLERLPEEQHFDVGFNADVSFQCNTQEEVRTVRAAFPGVIWTKAYVESGCNWWEYSGRTEDYSVKIYAVYEAPPTCRAIEETVMVEREVPVAFETQIVPEKRIRWDCSGDTP